ncbi:MAG TPA: acyltransferase [Solirubrobacteraceae bacterium]
MSATAVAAAHAPEPVVAPPPGNPRFPLMDALRAIAALSVLVGHVAGLTGIVRESWWSPLFGVANEGVTVFFVLSGFLLYRPLVNARLGGAPRPAWRDYARRRLLRILPAYWLALTVLAIYPGLPGVFSHDWWAYYLLLQVYPHDLALGGIVVAWSLAIEVSFYLLLPFLAAALGRLGRGRDVGTGVRRELAVLAALSVASLALRWLDPPFPSSLPVYFFWFAVGMGLALVSAALPRLGAAPRGAASWVERHPAACWAVALALYVALAYALGDPPAHGGYTDAQEVLLFRGLGGIMALFLVLPAVFGAAAGGWPRRVLAWPVLAWFGLISYGIYLWHLDLLGVIAGHVTVFGDTGLGGFVVLAGLTATAAAVAAASYYVVERPLLRFKAPRRGGTPRAPAPAAAVSGAGRRR